MTLRALALAILGAAAAVSQHRFSPPLVGVVRGPGQALQVIHGVAGNFALGDGGPDGAAQEPVLDWAFSGRAGIVKTDGELLLLDDAAHVVRRAPAPPGDAAFAFDTRGQAALYFFSGTGELWHITAPADRLALLDSGQLGGGVLAVAFAGQRRATIAVCREQSVALVTVDLDTGVLAQERRTRIPGCPPLVMFTGGLAYAAAGSAVIRANNGEEHRVKLPDAPRSLHQIGDGWLGIELANHETIALQLNAGGGTVFHLPRGGSR